MLDELTPVNYLPKLAMEAYCREQSARLPTEVEWELAATGPEKSSESFDSFVESANKFYETKRFLVDVGSTYKNKYGIAGMGGNVRELCADCYWQDISAARRMAWSSNVSPFFRPFLKKKGRKKYDVRPFEGVVRGRSFKNKSKHVIFSRASFTLSDMDEDVGFRVVLDPHVVLSSLKKDMLK